MKNKAVVNINGDLASTILIHQLISENKEVVAITFKREMFDKDEAKILSNLIEKFDLQVHEIDVTGVDYLFDDPLTSFLYMLSFQVTLAKSLEADIYSPSYNGDIYGTLPATISKSIFLGTNREVRLYCPYLRMTISDLERLQKKFNTNLDIILPDTIDSKSTKSVKLNPPLETVASDAIPTVVENISTTTQSQHINIDEPMFESDVNIPKMDLNVKSKIATP